MKYFKSFLLIVLLFFSTQLLSCAKNKQIRINAKTCHKEISKVITSGNIKVCIGCMAYFLKKRSDVVMIQVTAVKHNGQIKVFARGVKRKKEKKILREISYQVSIPE